MGTSHNFPHVCLRPVLLAGVVCAFLLVPAAQAAAIGTVEVTKTGPGAATSTVTSEPVGIDCGPECTYAFGVQQVRLTATPGAGYAFDGWSGVTCASGAQSNPCEFTSGGFSATAVMASFVPRPPAPVASTGASSDVSAHLATLEGTVDPEGSEVRECYFEYGNSTAYEHTVPCMPASPGAGVSAVAVSASLSGLSADTTYHYRLVATGLGGVSDGEDASVTTGAAPPELTAETPEYSQTIAHLRTLIDPENSLTTYHFSYGATTSYGQSVPVPDAYLGGSDSVVSVSRLITGLTPGVTYHYQLVATNAQGTTTGPDQSFTTLALPDDRAYEMVTPPFKSYNNFSLEVTGTATANIKAISSSGSQLLERSVPFVGAGAVPADEETAGTYYALERGASGWTTTSLTLPASVFPISQEELASPADTAVGLWAAATPSQSIEAEDFYRREADGAFINIGPIAPPAATVGPPHLANPGTTGVNSAIEDRIVGASADLSDAVFQMDSPQLEGEHSILWPGDGTVDGNRPSLYEYVGAGHSGEGGEVPALVGVDNTGAQISQCGIGLGADVARQATAVLPNGISAGGSTVFFNARAGGCVTGATGPAASQVYARIGTPGATQATVNVAAELQSECETLTWCNVTSPVTFQGASKEGSRVFFTAAQAGLLAGDTDASNALYECELPGDGGATPTPTGLVNACPDLKAVSVTGTSEGANVQSVAAVSEEGSRVYFTATGVLSSEPDLSLPAGHQVAEAGKDNLYLWEAPGEGDPTGHVAFVATLSETSPIEAQATPDGDFLVFTTATPELVSGDTSTAAQAFRYDAQSGELVRVSVGQEGFNSDGNTDENPATLAKTSAVLGRMTVSEDGSYVVFQSNEALTPQVHGGLHNVYEWHDGEVHLISDGVDTNNSAGLLGIDASGADIFFTTSEELVAQDTDEDVDVYDARTDGGFPEPAPAPSCEGETCQGALSGSLASVAPGSAAPAAIGNLAPPAKMTTTKSTKPLTRAQKLAKALKVCGKDKRKAKRAACKRAARKKFGPVKKKGKAKKRSTKHSKKKKG